MKKNVRDEADWTSSGRLFQSRGPAVGNQRSPTVSSREGRTSRSLEVVDRCRPLIWIVRTVLLRCDLRIAAFRNGDQRTG